ncbi:FecR family protein [Leptospira interrogans]
MRKALLLGSLVSSVLMAAPVSASQTPQIGSAVTVVNDVHAAYEQNQRALQSGDRVHEDELVEVGSDSRGELVLDDSTKLALGPGSRLLLDKFVYNGDRSKGDIVVNLMKGTFRFVTGAASKPSYRIRTPVAAISVRGTIFDTYVEDNGWIWLLLIEGAVRVCNDQGDCRMLNRPGQILQVTDRGRLGQPTRWASLQRRTVPLETAFPFIIAAPGIDPDPVLTRDDILTVPVPPRRTPPPRGGRKAGDATPKDRKVTNKSGRTRSADTYRAPQVPAFGFSFNFGSSGKSRPNRGNDRPTRTDGYRMPTQR